MKLPKSINITNSINSINIKKIFNEENRTKVIGFLTILILLWLILYLIPDIMSSLFNTFLGNLILFTIVALISLYNIKYGIISSLIIIILYRFSHMNKEGFSWTPNSTQNFLLIQNNDYK